jgi:arabinan endo-1,5-alpha-L-arabinosidase
MRLKHLVILSVGITTQLIVGCKNDDLKPTGITTKDPDTVADFTAPTYADDYSSISSWSNRSQWNLANVHDPSVVYDGEYYYMYGTDASYGNAHEGHGHFLYRRSKDLVTWEFQGMAMAQTPAWVKDTLNNMRARVGLASINSPVYGHWAPVVRKVGNKYRMYYSIVVDNYIKNGMPNTAANFDNSWTEHAFIGLMETTSLKDNVWTDRGMVVSSVSDRGNDWSRTNRDTDWSAYFKWNAIDPSYIVTPEGQHWLIYGSWHSGIVALSLNPDTGKPDKLETLDDYGVRIARRQDNDANRWQAQEGPEIIYNANTGYYYLFLAYDELSVAYNTRVCRSKSITGPWLGIDGKNITQGGECWPLRAASAGRC